MITMLTASMLAGAALAQQAAPGASTGPARSPSHAQPKPFSVSELRGYSVVLVVGDMQSPGGADSVPAAARKALTDMQAFLPYKRYQLLDAAWMTCCAMYRSPIVGRLRGPDDRDYSYTIDTLSGENGRLTVRFFLREGDEGPLVSITNASRVSAQQPALSAEARSEHLRQWFDAQKERDEAELQQRRAKQMYDVGTMPTADYELARRRYQLAQARLQELDRALGRNETTVSSSRPNLLDSTFSIALGETVVIGTSRLKGDQALIALLTAAGNQGGSR